MSITSLIDLRVQDAVATLTLNIPEKRNAISDDMRTELIAPFEHATNDASIRTSSTE